MSKIDTEESTVAMTGQKWRHKYSGKKLIIIGHITGDLWVYEQMFSKSVSQVTGNELMSDWKKMK